MKLNVRLLPSLRDRARSAATTSEEKTFRSFGSTCLLSFIVSGVATLLVCTLTPVRSLPLPVRPPHLPGSGKAEVGASTSICDWLGDRASVEEVSNG
jgi:hypothetical protein